MRYESLEFTDVEINIDSIDLQISPTDELIDITDNIRKEKGYTDLFSIDNDIYYNFYVVCYPDKNEIGILATCNYGKFDDYANYELPMTSEEKENVMFQIIKEIIKE